MAESLLVQSAQTLQELLSFFELRKEFLFFPKGRGMHQAAAAAELDWMPQVQHLMIDEIFDGIERTRAESKTRLTTMVLCAGS